MSYNTTTDLLLAELVQKMETLIGASQNLGNQFGTLRSAGLTFDTNNSSDLQSLTGLSQVTSLVIQNTGAASATVTVASGPVTTLASGKSITFYPTGGGNVFDLGPISYDATGTTLTFNYTY